MFGYGPEDLQKANFAWILINWKVKIFSRPSWGEKITIKTWVRETYRCYSYRDLEVYDDEDNLIAIASTRWTLINLLTKSISKVPPEMAEKYSFLDKRVFEEPIFDKIPEPSNSNLTFEYTIQRRDIDPNNHTNNVNYLSFAYEALPHEIYNRSTI